MVTSIRIGTPVTHMPPMDCRRFVCALLLALLLPPAGRGAAARSIRLPGRDRLSLEWRDSELKLSTPIRRKRRVPTLPRCYFKGPSKLRSKPDVPHATFFDNYTEVGYEAAQRYRIQMQLGKGAEGTVVGAVDVATGTEVAIKKLKNIAKNTHHANNILREVMLSNGMAGLGGVVQVKRFIPPSDTGNFSTLFIVMERMAGNLFDEKEITRGFDLRTQKWLAYQMLSALQSMHAAGFLHRDISPTNVFVKSDCSVKLGDFGMTRVIRSYTPEDFKDGQMNMPPQTNWIEDPAVDVFHMGKTILSMACGANRMYKQQDRDKFVRAMLKEHGRPPEHVLVKLSPPAMAVIRSSADKDDDGPTFESFWPEVHPDILHLSKRMLLWDLREIPSAADLMLDPIFDEIMDLRGPRVGPRDLAARPWDIPRSLDGGKIFKALSKGMGVIDSKLLADVPDAEHAS